MAKKGSMINEAKEEEKDKIKMFITQSNVLRVPVNTYTNKLGASNPKIVEVPILLQSVS